MGVTPYGGVWIEMWKRRKPRSSWAVTPYGGVWIEMPEMSFRPYKRNSHALWRRVD